VICGAASAATVFASPGRYLTGASRKHHRWSPLAQKHGKFGLQSDLACTTSLMLSNLGSHKAPPPSNGEKAEKSSSGLGTFLPPQHLINTERLIHIENKRICP
jgi:hypothetical protein